MKTYNFGTHWVTTDEILTDYISCFDVTPEEAAQIELGATPEDVNDTLVIDVETMSDPIIEEPII